MPDFSIGDHDFLLDGRPFRIISGAMHYFRVHPDQWEDRIDKARMMGLNTIETYIAWNAHAPDPDTFLSTGGNDLDRYLSLIAAAGMKAIVRPGPYICAEWDNGGLPSWLLRDERVGVRSNEPHFLDAVGNYLGYALDIVRRHQIDRGGPVILVQIENEYGAYGQDKDYLRALVDLTRAAGITVPLISVDQPTDEMLSAGSLPGVHKTASFGSRVSERLATLRRHQPTGPLMCAEFWVGWFDQWGEHHHLTSAEEAAADLDTMLASGASVNIYMFHGGSNFGLTSGANDKGTYQAIITSYDYDAPLDEAGNPTEKYFAFRDVIAGYGPVPDEAPRIAEPASAFELRMDSVGRVLDCLDASSGWRQFDDRLPTIDEVEPNHKLMAVRTQLAQNDEPVLVFGEVRDRVSVFLDGAPVGTLQRDHHERAIALPRGHGNLMLLVEDLGRVSYGSRIGEAKGLVGGASLGHQPLLSWEALTIDAATIPRLFGTRSPTDDNHGRATRFQRPGNPACCPGAIGGPVVLRATFDLAGPGDLFLDTEGWGHGYAWLNGFLLGRFWSRGPQRTLYVPGPVVRPVGNELLVLEMGAMQDVTARFVSGPLLGHTES